MRALKLLQRVLEFGVLLLQLVNQRLAVLLEQLGFLHNQCGLHWSRSLLLHHFPQRIDHGLGGCGLHEILW